MKNLIYRKQVIRVIENIDLPFAWLIGDRGSKKIRDVLIEAIMDLDFTRYDDIIPHAKQIIVGTKSKGSRITRCSRCKVERRNAGKANYCRDCGAKFDIVEAEEV